MFLSSAFLWGLTALGLPVVIHMMQSPMARVLDFPSVRFLKICQKNAVRRTRLKNLILLLLRMILLALIAFGMAKPWEENEKSEALPEAPISMVIVLDNSYSMGYIDKGTSRFDRARDAAIGLIDGLKPGDEAAVLLMNVQPVPFVRELTTDLAQVKNALRDAELSVLGTQVDLSLREALRIVGKTGGPAPDVKPGEEPPDTRRRREVHVLTDLQASSWEEVVKSGFLKTVDTKARIFVSSFGRKGSPNSYIESMSVGASGTDETTITAKIMAMGAGSPGNIITLNVNGKNVTQEGFSVRPGTPMSVPLVTRFREAGTYRCILDLQGDELAIDDRYYFTVEVGEKSSVLVVDGDPSAVSTLSETFFLWSALNPGSATGTASPIEARKINIGEFPTVGLDDQRCVTLCNVPHLDGADLLKLENYLRGGGSLLIFLGDNVTASEYNPWSFLPITLEGPVGDATKEKTFGMGEQRGDHPMFARKIDVRSAKFFACVASRRDSLKKGGAVLASFSNGQPALVEGRFEEKGKVLLFTSSCDLDWNNFPLRRAFLPWLYQALYYLSNQDTIGKSYRLGDEIKFQALAAAYKKSITITDPEGNRIVLRPEVVGGSAEVAFTGTKLPGMYAVDADKAFTNSSGFGVNLDITESAIAMADPDVIKDAAAPDLLVFLDTARIASIAKEIKRTREGKEYWPLLFKLALLMFVIESLFGNFISRTRKASGSEAPLFEVLKQRNPGIDQ